MYSLHIRKKRKPRAVRVSQLDTLTGVEIGVWQRVARSVSEGAVDSPG